MKKLLLLIVPVLLSGCATKVAFTPNLIEEYKLNGEALKDLQFYTSDKIVLTRAVTSESAGAKDHELKRIRDRFVEVVTIRKDTPGRIKEIGDGEFAICFEEGGVLTFTSKSPSAKVPYKEHTSTNISGYRLYRLSRDGKIDRADGNSYEYGPHMYKYAEKEFASFNYRNVFLKVDRDSIEHLCKTRKIAPGCKFAAPCAQK